MPGESRRTQPHSPPVGRAGWIDRILVFGLEVTAAGSAPLADRIAAQARLLAALAPPQASLPVMERAVEVRYIAWPDSARPWASRVEAYLLARVSAPTQSWATEATRGFGADLERLVPEFVPGVQPRRLGLAEARGRALCPFEIADTGEVDDGRQATRRSACHSSGCRTSGRSCAPWHSKPDRASWGFASDRSRSGRTI